MSYIGAEPTTAAFPFDQFSGTGAATAFTLTQAPAGNTSVIVYVGGAVQNPNTYTIVGTTITFSVAPVAGTNNIGVLLLGLPALVGVPNTGTVTPAMLSTGGPSWNTGGTLTATTFSGAGTSLTGTAASLSIGGNAANVSGTVAIANGGTGATTRQNAMDTLAGATTSGQYLRGNGTDVVMAAIVAADVPTLNQNTTGSSASCTGNAATVTTVTTSQVMSAIAASALNDVGSYAFARKVVNASPQTAGQNTAGTDLRYSDTGNNASGPVINVGTWRCLGHQTFGDRTVLWLRIS